MDLIVNISSLAPPVAGIGRYTQELLKRLMVDERVGDITGFSQFGVYAKPALSDLVHGHVRPTEGRGLNELKKVLRGMPGAYFVRYGLRQWQLSKVAKRYPDAVMWEPNYALQNFAGPCIATLHDLSYLRYPEFHHQAMLTWLNKQVPKTVGRADAFVTLSEFSKQELVQELGIAPEKIHIVPPAVDESFRFRATSGQLHELKLRYDLPQHFILSVSTLEPRKNIRGLIEAYSLLPESLKKQYPLVIVGANGWGKQEFQQQYQSLLNKEQLYFLGYVAQADLPLIYQAADLFAFLSFYEGYGMPVAEAMASGVAVLASDRASVPEVAQGCALLVAPDNPQAIFNGLMELLETPALREQMQGKGRQIAQGYHWDVSANRLIELCRTMRHG